MFRVKSWTWDLGNKEWLLLLQPTTNIITTAAAANDSAPGNSTADASFSNNTKPAFTDTKTASLSLTLASSRSQI